MPTAEPCPVKRRTRWVMGLGIAAFIAAIARPSWDILVSIFEDPLADHGTAYIALVNDRPEDVWIMAYELGRYRRSLAGYTDGRGYRIGEPSQAGTMRGELMSAPEGRRHAEINYRIGTEDEVRSFRFEVDIVAGYSCRMVVAFRAEGPRASACTNPMPGTYGGTWLH